MPQFIGDVFGLSSVYERQVANVEQNNLANWPEIRFGAYGSPAIYGYFGGGYLSPPTTSSSTVARLDLTTEGTTLGTGSTLLVRGRGVSSISNHLYGYFAGGANGSFTNLTRLDYSNETVSSPGTGSIIGIRYDMAALSGFSYGYFAGGFYTVPQTSFSTIQRFDYSNETITNPGKNLTLAKGSFSGVLNNLYGYFGGGESSAAVYTSVITRIDLVSETTSDPGNNLPLDVSRNASISNDKISYGYFGGGYRGGAPNTSVITRLDFSTENINLPGNNFPSVPRSHSATTFNNSYGYFAGGASGPPLLSVSIVSRLDFSTELVSNPATNLPVIRRGHGGATQLSTVSVYRGSKTYGYITSGSIVNRFDFSNETIRLPGNDLPVSRSLNAAVNNNNYGYFAGGLVPPNTSTSQITRFDFSNETSITPPSAKLLNDRLGLGASQSNIYGYFGGGYIPPVLYYSSVNRLEFSTETVSDPGKPFSPERNRISFNKNNFYGYMSSGATPSPNNTNIISRIDFTTEVTSNPGKNMPRAIWNTTALPSSYCGYFCGGIVSQTAPLLPDFQSNISRLDFSNETVSQSPTLSLSPTLNGALPAFNSSYGYLCGGGGTPGNSSTIRRLDFSVETLSNPGKNLPATISALGGSGVSR